MDSLINLIIVLIPLSIFIGRAVVSARKKHQPPPKPQVQPKVEEENIPHWIREAAKVSKAPAPRKQKVSRKPQPAYQKAGDLAASIESERAATPAPAAGKVPVKAPLPVEKPITAPSERNPFNLGNLSPLKQAVVMAEILGPPKGLQ